MLPVTMAVTDVWMHTEPPGGYLKPDQVAWNRSMARHLDSPLCAWSGCFAHVLPRQRHNSNAIFCRTHMAPWLRLQTNRAKKFRTLVLKRDGWLCHLCGRRISPGAMWPWPTALTIDHVVPMSEGGESVAENLRPAHLRCNLLRKGRTIEVTRVLVASDEEFSRLLAMEVA